MVKVIKNKVWRTVTAKRILGYITAKCGFLDKIMEQIKDIKEKLKKSK